MNENILQDAGLTPIEAKVYMTLLEQGALLAGVLSRKSGVHRRSVYDVMDRLIEKGLVSYIVKNNRRYYQATNPDRLLEIIKEKESVIEKSLPGLRSKYEAKKEKQETLFFRGKPGLKAIFDELEPGKEVLLLAATDYWTAVSKFFFAKYDLLRKKNKVKMRVIFSKKKRGSVKIPLAQIRFLSQEYDTPVSIAVHGEKVSIIAWTANPFAILIKEKAIADAYRTYFEALWKIAKE